MMLALIHSNRRWGIYVPENFENEGNQQDSDKSSSECEETSESEDDYEKD